MSAVNRWVKLLADRANKKDIGMNKSPIKIRTNGAVISVIRMNMNKIKMMGNIRSGVIGRIPL